MINITEENFKIIDYCAKQNPAKFNMDKALEENVEFMEVLLKLQTKHIDNEKRPKLEEAVKEFGDSIYRGLIALKTLNPNISNDALNQMISEHINIKLSKLTVYKAKGKYKGGL